MIRSRRCSAHPPSGQRCTAAPANEPSRQDAQSKCFSVITPPLFRRLEFMESAISAPGLTTLRSHCELTGHRPCQTGTRCQIAAPLPWLPRISRKLRTGSWPGPPIAVMFLYFGVVVPLTIVRGSNDISLATSPRQASRPPARRSRSCSPLPRHRPGRGPGNFAPAGQSVPLNRAFRPEYRPRHPVDATDRDLCRTGSRHHRPA